jgi:plasmid stabilization system protein ParE
MQVIFTGAARRELREATTWFQEHSELGGAGFAALIRQAVAQIREVPFGAPRWVPAPRFRAWTVQHVDYRLFYEVIGPTIRIVAITHTSRRPGYWLDRLP